jgi:hypothetical protein
MNHAMEPAATGDIMHNLDLLPGEVCVKTCRCPCVDPCSRVESLWNPALGLGASYPPPAAGMTGDDSEALVSAANVAGAGTAH